MDATFKMHYCTNYMWCLNRFCMTFMSGLHCVFIKVFKHSSLWCIWSSRTSYLGCLLFIVFLTVVLIMGAFHTWLYSGHMLHKKTNILASASSIKTWAFPSVWKLKFAQILSTFPILNKLSNLNNEPVPFRASIYLWPCFFFIYGKVQLALIGYGLPYWNSLF